MITRKPSRSRSDSCWTGAGFFKEESGAYTIFAIIGFSMLMVAIGLVIDVGRVMNVHSQASAYADRVALAAAAELDGRPDSIDRAVFRAQQLGVRGDRLTLSGDNAIGIERLVFMSDIASDPLGPEERSPLPGDDELLTVSGDATPGGLASPGQAIAARYVLVETTPETENYLFFRLFGALTPTPASATVAPQAVAGYRRTMCNTAPIMVCNPSESLSIGAAFNPNNGFSTRLTLQNGPRWRASNYSLLRINSTVLGIPLNLNLGNLLGGPDPQTACFGDRIRAAPLSTLSLGLGLSLPALRTEINAGLNERLGEDLPVAVVNCRQNRLRLLLGLEVPVEAYVRVRLGSVGANADIELQPPSVPRPTPGTDALREYPVLMR